MNPVVALRMKQDAVFDAFRTTLHERNAVVKAPSRDPSDFDIANSAETTLLHPEKAKCLGTPERVQHVRTFPIFEIGFILWVVRVGFAFHFSVSFDGCVTGVVQPSFAWLSLVITSFPEETPVASAIALIVFLFEPGRGLFRVPSPCPLPQSVEDRIVHVREGTFADHVPMIVGPTSNLWVELIDQIGGRHANPGFDCYSDSLQEGFNVLLGRLDEQFPVRVAAHVLSEEIKAFLHVRNDRLRGREFEPPLLKELLNKGLDPSLQQVFRFTGNDEIIRIANEIHRRILISKGLEACSCWVVFLQKSLKSIQRAIRERWGDNSTLWGSIRRFVEDMFFHVPRFQPLLENGSVHRDVCQQPIVGNVVETGLDVTFQNPLRVRCVRQRVETLFNRIGAGPFLTKPIGVSISVGFQHGVERKQMQGLVSSIDHAGNSERAHRFAVRFRYIDTS